MSFSPLIWMAPGMMLCFLSSPLDFLRPKADSNSVDASERTVRSVGRLAMDTSVAPAAIFPELLSFEIWTALSASSALWKRVAIRLASSRLAWRGSMDVSHSSPRSMR